MIDYVFRTGKNYSPQEFLEKFKNVVKEKKMAEYITDNIEISSVESDKDSLLKKVLITLIKKVLLRKAFSRKQFE